MHGGSVRTGHPFGRRETEVRLPLLTAPPRGDHDVGGRICRPAGAAHRETAAGIARPSPCGSTPRLIRVPFALLVAVPPLICAIAIAGIPSAPEGGLGDAALNGRGGRRGADRPAASAGRGGPDGGGGAVRDGLRGRSLADLRLAVARCADPHPIHRPRAGVLQARLRSAEVVPSLLWMAGSAAIFLVGAESPSM